MLICYCIDLLLPLYCFDLVSNHLLLSLIDPIDSLLHLADWVVFRVLTKSDECFDQRFKEEILILKEEILRLRKQIAMNNKFNGKQNVDLQAC